MFLELSLHQFIEDYNVLQRPTEQASEYLREHPRLYKIALVVNHIFRALAMTALCLALPFAVPINIAICFAGSLFYRLTVETNCAYKFALPAFAGSVAFPLAFSASMGLVTHIAFAPLATLAVTFSSFLPLAGYLAYIVLTVSYDVDHR